MAWFDTLLKLKAQRNGSMAGMFAPREVASYDGYSSDESVAQPELSGLSQGTPPQAIAQQGQPQGWEAALAAQLPQGPTGAAPEMPVVEDDPNNFLDYAPDPRAGGNRHIADNWRKNRLVRLQNEPTSDYRRRLSESEPKGERSWADTLKSGGAGVLRGLGTLPTNNPRIRLGGGNYAGAALGGFAGNVLMNLLDPNGQAEAWKDKELGQLRQAEADDLKQRETEADIRYKDTQRQEFGLKREEAARKSRVQALQRQLQLVLGKGQGLNRDDPEAARLIAALEKENLYTPDLGPDVVRAVPIHDEATGEDFWETTLKDGTVKRTSTGGSHTSATKVNNDTRKKIAADSIEARAALQKAQQEFQREENEKKAANALRLKQTPGAKAAGDNKPARHPVPHSAVVARANQLMYSDPNGELKFGQAYDRAAKEVKDDNGYIDGNQ